MGDHQTKLLMLVGLAIRLFLHGQAHMVIQILVEVKPNYVDAMEQSVAWLMTSQARVKFMASMSSVLYEEMCEVLLSKRLKELLVGDCGDELRKSRRGPYSHEADFPDHYRRRRIQSGKAEEFNENVTLGRGWD